MHRARRDGREHLRDVAGGDGDAAVTAWSEATTDPDEDRWTVRAEELDPETRRVALLRAGAPPSFAEVARLWRDDASFRDRYLGLLAEAPFRAFRWETPPVTAATLGRDFEHVLLRSDALARLPPEPEAFADRFAAAPEADVLTIPNLGGDALLVVPAPRAPDAAYPHLAAFVRAAPAGQRHALLRAVGAAVLERAGAAPIWLSTAGLAVGWVHVRLDSRPKYVRHAPYRAWPAAPGAGRR